jgi:hypothetical protein
MKVRSKANLKVAEGRIEPMGTVYSDVDGALPDFVLAEMGEDLSNTRYYEVIEGGEEKPKGPESPAADTGKQGAPAKTQAKKPVINRRK